MRRWLAWLGATSCVVAASWLWTPLAEVVRATCFLRSMAATPAPAPAPARGGTQADGTRPAAQEHELYFTGAHAEVHTRLYVPRGKIRHGVVVAHGVHHLGLDEPRLVRFSRELARQGVLVSTPAIPDLAAYRVTSQGIGILIDAVLALRKRAELPSAEQVGLLGFSFAGGLALVAAAEPALKRQLRFAASVGGHHDLARVLGFLVHDRIATPDGFQRLSAHDYGLVILVLSHLERFVPEVDRTVMAQALEAWLREDRARALSRASLSITYESEQLWTLLETQRLRVLAPELDALLAAQAAELRALSPRGRLHDITAPVYLLHGSEDTVVPASELTWAVRELGAHEHRALISPLLGHVEVSRKARASDSLALVWFMAHVL